MPRYLLTIAYDGTLFRGWQHQKRTVGGEVASDTPALDAGAGTGAGERSTAATGETPVPQEPLRTVQETVQDAIRLVVREPITLTGASRTDSGVHALGQAAAFTTASPIPLEKLARAINSRLPEDVRILKAAPVPDDFNPIRDAIAKGYRYSIAHGEALGRVTSPLARRRMTVVQPRLDAVAMNDAARRLIGEHDFASFTRQHHDRLTTVRTIFDCKVAEPRPSTPRGGRIDIEVVGSGFLYNMVRIIAGTLVDVGRGLRTPEDMHAVLAAQHRDAAGPTMPARGLCLMWIRYPTRAQMSDPPHPPA